MPVGDEQKNNATALIVYRLEVAEKKLDTLDDKLLDLSKGFVGMKVELEHVAKNEGKTSGAISGVVTATIVTMITIFVQFALNLTG